MPIILHLFPAAKVPFFQNAEQAAREVLLMAERLSQPVDLSLQAVDLLLQELRAAGEFLLELLLGVAVVVMDRRVELSFDVLPDVPVVVVDARSSIRLVDKCGRLPVTVVLEQFD